MKDARLWILVLALVSGLCGSAVTVLVRRISTIESERGPFAAYADQLVQEFDLSPERATHLRKVLLSYASEIERIRKSHEVAFYATLEADLRPTGEEYNALIRDAVLPPDKRERFDAMVAGMALAPGAD